MNYGTKLIVNNVVKTTYSLLIADQVLTRGNTFIKPTLNFVKEFGARREIKKLNKSVLRGIITQKEFDRRFEVLRAMYPEYIFVRTDLKL